MSTDSDPQDEPARRGFVRRALLPLFAALLGGALGEGKAQAQDQPSDALARRFVLRKPDIPPLDSPIVFGRQDESNDGKTHEVVSLIQQEDGENSFPWTLYAQLRTKHRGGDGVVFYSRLYKDGPGWSCGLHSEVFAKNWGVGIGVNIEVANQYEGDEGFNGVIGIEMQSLGPRRALAGLQIEGKGGYETLVRLRADAQTGLDLTGRTEVGINLHQSSLRLDEGAWVELDAEGQVRMRYYEGNIEFFRGDRRIAHLPVDAEDHEL